MYMYMCMCMYIYTHIIQRKYNEHFHKSISATAFIN